MIRIIVLSMLIPMLSISGQGQQWSLFVENDAFNYVTPYKIESIGDDILVLGNVEQYAGEDQWAAIRWDGFSSSLFGGLVTNHRANCFVEDYLGNSYFGGSFNNFQSLVHGDKICGFDGEAWFELGQGICSVSSEVNDLEVFQGELIMCGPFSDVNCEDEIYWARIAAWNGTSWHTMGGVLGGVEPRKLIVYDNKLFVIGYFSLISIDNTLDNYFNVGNIAYYDGANWGSPLNGVNGELADAVVDEAHNLLYVAGYFTNASGVPVSNVAAWDGTNWSAVGDNLTGDIYALEMYRGQLYAGGYNVMTNGGTLAFFDGVEWQSVQSSPYSFMESAYVRDLKAFDDELYVAGRFDFVDQNIAVPNLVRYFLHPDSVQWGVPDYVNSIAESRTRMYPNPASDILNFQFEHTRSGDITIIELSGREVMRKSFDHMKEISLNTSDIVCGEYLVIISEKNIRKEVFKLHLH